jgi:sporulation protein YlmC with PRC-barrel domain
MPAAQPEINDRWLDTSTLVGLEVMGDDGNRIGRLVDATFDQDTLEIGAYLLGVSFLERLIGRRDRIQPASVHSCSRELMIETTGRVKEADVAAAPDETVPIDVPMELKDADRLPSATFESAPDGQPVGARRR